MPVRRVVTGFTPDGSPTVLFDGPAPAEMSMPPTVGAGLVDLWRSDDLPVETMSSDDATAGEFELMPAGCLFRVIDLEPGGHDPMWHTHGQRRLQLRRERRGDRAPRRRGCGADRGAPRRRRHVRAPGPRHAWVNRGAEVCRLVCTSVAAGLPPGVEPG